MLTIRLQRVGKKNQAAFRIVLAEKHRSAKKMAVEILGHYNPRTKEFGLKNPERVKYWVAQHVEVSPTVHNLLIDKGLLSGQKVKAWRPKAKSSESVATKKEENTKSEEAKPVESPTETKSEEKVEETKPELAKTEKAEAPSEQ